MPGVSSSGIAFKDPRHFQRVLNVVPDLGNLGVADRLWEVRHRLFPDGLLRSLQQNTYQNFVDAGFNVGESIKLTTVGSIPGQLYTLAETLTLPIPPPNAPISTGQATPRSEPMHPTGVTDDPRIAQDILDFCNQFVDPFEGEALYPTSLLGPGSASVNETAVHAYLLNKVFFLPNMFLRNLVTLEAIPDYLSCALEDGRPYAWKDEQPRTPPEDLRQVPIVQNQDGTVDFGLIAAREQKGNTEAKALHFGPRTAEMRDARKTSAARTWNQNGIPEAPSEKRLLYFVRDGFAQGFRYCHARELARFGLSTGVCTYMALIQASGHLNVSAAIGLHPLEAPTLKQAMFWLTLTSLTDSPLEFTYAEGWQQDPIGAEQREGGGEESRGCGGVGRGRRGRSRGRGRGSGGGGGRNQGVQGGKVTKHDERQPLRELNKDLSQIQSPTQSEPTHTNVLSETALALQAANISVGDLQDICRLLHTANVYKLRINGIDVAAKIAPRGGKACAVLQQEAANYSELSSVQGDAIPTVRAAGFMKEKTCYTLATDYCPYRVDLLIDRPLYTTAKQSLQKLHSLGWQHGDVAGRNMAVAKNPMRIMMLDLGMASKGTEEDFLNEEYDLNNIFSMA